MIIINQIHKKSHSSTIILNYIKKIHVKFIIKEIHTLAIQSQLFH